MKASGNMVAFGWAGYCGFVLWVGKYSDITQKNWLFITRLPGPKKPVWLWMKVLCVYVSDFYKSKCQNHPP